MTATVIHADCLTALRDMPDASVSAVVCDPPYGLSNTDPAHVVDTLTRWAAGDREYVPTGRGFMGKSWDAFVPPPAVWDECFRVLKPGGHLLCFAGSRTFDLMTLSIRFAGFDIRDSIAWLYGSGFPKSLDVSKAVDKLDAAAERRARALEFTAWMRSTGITGRQINEATGTNMGGHYLTAESQPAVATADLFDLLRPLLSEVPERIEGLVRQRTVESANYAARPITQEERATTRPGDVIGFDQRSSTDRERRDIAHTDDARAWQGWGTALKPAHEPIVRARKPFSVVPFGHDLNRAHHALGALLWLAVSPARRAELTSPSSPHALPAGTCASALAAAATGTSLDASEPTATYNSPALASTCSNIVSSWSATLAGLSDPTTTSTTSTASSMTTALRTLSSLLAPLTSLTTMPACECLADGSASPANSADETSTDEWARWRHTLSASAPASAIEPIAHAAASLCAELAASLSADAEVASTARRGATTAADGGPDPAFEPVVVARKLLAGTVAANVLAHGTGALNIDATRVATEESLGRPYGGGNEVYGTFNMARGTRTGDEVNGRWPANVVLDGDAADALDVQSGPTGSWSPAGKSYSGSPTDGTSHLATLNGRSSLHYGGYGTGASKFFPTFRDPEASWPSSHSAQDPQETPEATTSAQASTPGAFLAGEAGSASVSAPVTRVSDFDLERLADHDYLYDDWEVDAVVAELREWRASYEPTPTFRYQAKAPTRERPSYVRDDGTKVAHPTVKPVELMRWLVRLVTPPGGMVLDPFAGSGATVEAAMLEGFDVTGVEREADYLPLIQQRIDRAVPTVAVATGEGDIEVPVDEPHLLDLLDPS